MMDDKHLTAGLSLLAEELTDPAVDIDAAIRTARQQAHHRQAVTATAAGTVLVMAAIATFVATTDRGADTVGGPPSCASPSQRPDGTKSGTRPSSGKSEPFDTATIVDPPPGATITAQSPSAQPPSTDPCGPVDGQRPAEWKVDQRATNLTEQLAAANLIPPNLRISRDDSVNTRAIKGGPPPALEFGTLTPDGGSDRPLDYTAFAKLTDEQGAAFLRIEIDKGEHGPASVPFGPCQPGSPVCTTKDFADGTKAAWHTHIGDAMGWNQIMGAVRPDGTTIVVSISVWPDTQLPDPTRPEVPLTPDQLYAFATAFTY